MADWARGGSAESESAALLLLEQHALGGAAVKTRGEREEHEAGRDAELVVPHRTYSGFFGTDLDASLRSRGVDTLVLTGCLTEIHLFATAVDALQRGYRVEIPGALQAGSSELAEAVVLKTLSVMAPTAPLP